MDTKLKYIILLLLLTSPASAKFICGEVQSTDSMSPSWFEVKTYLATNENYFSNCQVSPANNRYCCDLDVIKDRTGYQWKSGDIFKTKITDKSSGYFATPKNLTLSGEGYDVAPTLILEKAIRIIQPNTTLTISKSQIPIELNFSQSCTNQTLSQTNLALGKNIITTLATCNNEIFTENKTFFLIQNLTFQKQYSEQFGNNKNKPKIRSDTEGTITLQARLSHEVEGIQLKEYVPSSWEISNISNNGVAQFSTPQYNVITWQVNGDNFTFSYQIKSPKIKSRPEEFVFKTQLDKNEINEAKVEVYKFIPLPITPKPYLGGWCFNPKNFSKVSEIFPLIFKDKGLTAALYSSQPIEQSAFNLLDFLSTEKFDRQYDYLKSYQVQTTLNKTEQGKMVFEYEINKTFLEENNYKEIGFFEKNAGKFLKITGGVIGTTENTIKYRFESEDPLDEIFILAEKNSLTIFDKILNFLDKLKFW